MDPLAPVGEAPGVRGERGGARPSPWPPWAAAWAAFRRLPGLRPGMCAQALSWEAGRAIPHGHGFNGVGGVLHERCALALDELLGDAHRVALRREQEAPPGQGQGEGEGEGEGPGQGPGQKLGSGSGLGPGSGPGLGRTARPRTCSLGIGPGSGLG